MSKAQKKEFIYSVNSETGKASLFLEYSGTTAEDCRARPVRLVTPRAHFLDKGHDITRLIGQPDRAKFDLFVEEATKALKRQLSEAEDTE